MALDHQTIEELARSPAGRFSAERNHNYMAPGLSGHVIRYDAGPLQLKFVALAITDSVAGAEEIAKQIALELNSVGELAREVLRHRSEAMKGGQAVMGTSERNAKILELRKTGASMLEIARKLGTSKNTVVGVVNRAYGKELPAFMKGQKW